MAELQLDLFANPNVGAELNWFPGSMLPEDGQEIMEVYENDDGTPSDIILSRFHQAAYDAGWVRPIIWWTPKPMHPSGSN